MKDDIYGIGMQGGFGRGMGDLFTGSWVPGRRRWPRRDIPVEHEKNESEVKADQKVRRPGSRPPEPSP